MQSLLTIRRRQRHASKDIRDNDLTRPPVFRLVAQGNYLRWAAYQILLSWGHVRRRCGVLLDKRANSHRWPCKGDCFVAGQRAVRPSMPFREKNMPKVSRYHPMLVALHWILAFLIIAALALGALVMVKIPNIDPTKLEALRSHMIGGAVILLLMLVRLVARAFTERPPAASTGSPV